MPVKIKPSTKDYKRDSNGRMTNKWIWKHYTVSNTSTEELLKLLVMDTQKKNKSKIQRELTKRGVQWEK